MRAEGLDFRDVVLEPVSDFGRRVARVTGSSVVCEFVPLEERDSTVAPAAADFPFAEDGEERGTIVRPCCSVDDATADV